MKKIKYLILAIVLTATVSLNAQSTGSQLFTESLSKYNFDETVIKLNEIITGDGWKVMIVHDLKATLQKHNFDVLPVQVFEICNPKYSSKMLEKDELRIYSSLMPCRFSIYEKSDGKTYISRMNSTMIAESIGGVVEEVMSQVMYDTEKYLEQVIVK
jgi:uncharacterized protein (DUF302 family)